MIKVLVIFGGRSSEHDISCMSAGNVLENMDSKKYQVIKIGIDKEGNWLKYNGQNFNIKENRWLNDIENIEKVENIIGILKWCDIAYPVLHGIYGEDGTIQGLFDTFNIKYVGCNTATSAIGMDKEYSKILAESVKIPVVPYYVLKKTDYLNINELINKIKLTFKFPVIVKPSNGGSSIGTIKVKYEDNFKEVVEDTFKYDDKILIEECIDAQEIECAVLGNNNYIISDIGQIIPANEFYDFNAKYESNKSICKIPADISQKEEIRKYTEFFANAINVKGLARIDFFVSKTTGKIYFNEINTMPGFTDISMYPKLMEYCGVNYIELIDTLIQLGLQ